MVADKQHSIAITTLDAIPEAGGYAWHDPADPLFSLMFFKQGEQVFAYHNVCPHQGRPLGLGRPGGAQRFFFDDNHRLVCPHHGAVFQINDGACVSGPCRGAALKSVAVRVVEGQVYVDTPVESAGMDKN